MKVVEQGFEIMRLSEEALLMIEEAGRTAYKSEDRISLASSGPFVENLVKRNHGAVLEFADMTVRFITDRGISHELVRHRMASFCQESSRYVGYGEAKGGVTYIRPVWVSSESVSENWEAETYLEGNYSIKELTWIENCMSCEMNYNSIINAGGVPQEARQVLNNSTKTEVVMKANFREWRHVFQLRCDRAAHPQMRALMIPLYKKMRDQFPQAFSLGEFDV